MRKPKKTMMPEIETDEMPMQPDLDEEEVLSRLADEYPLGFNRVSVEEFAEKFSGKESEFKEHGRLFVDGQGYVLVEVF